MVTSAAGPDEIHCVLRGLVVMMLVEGRVVDVDFEFFSGPHDTKYKSILGIP